MTNESSTGSDIVSSVVPHLAREKVTVRRRRARQGHRSKGRWAAARSRRRLAQTAALCAGVLLLMAIGLYFGLTRQEQAPSGEGAWRGVFGSRSMA